MNKDAATQIPWSTPVVDESGLVAEVYGKAAGVVVEIRAIRAVGDKMIDTKTARDAVMAAAITAETVFGPSK